ncbi:uncharacterized protein BDCG_08384 [Blastomyces dermatitidis ER-3]|uniref:Uncharacterized protein n=2 Tax=Ajellomyces dermatitidis TaxID=5039 RepID=F2T4U5_AJEDA|nr:uncharacterized protein BDCG_08384 [Blastomyces dermatitidis ER-3]EEQ85115.2 hypothetical protein BDCG_08384 [Blastomyces dermatitidis ER-3]EGE78170.1 hypothetical protein BDDG_01107 [Blastomyces dermatitidis ATCC 18188]
MPLRMTGPVPSWAHVTLKKGAQETTALFSQQTKPLYSIPSLAAFHHFVFGINQVSLASGLHGKVNKLEAQPTRRLHVARLGRNGPELGTKIAQIENSKG